jgi:hypothetical protein
LVIAAEATHTWCTHDVCNAVGDGREVGQVSRSDLEALVVAEVDKNHGRRTAAGKVVKEASRQAWYGFHWGWEQWMV